MFVFVSGKANIKRLFAKYDIPVNGVKVVFAINGFDCVNCYKSLSEFLKKLDEKQFEDSYAVISGITERELPLFIKNTLATSYPFKKIILDNDFFNKLNRRTTSEIITFNGTKEVSRHTASTIAQFDFTKLESHQLVPTVTLADTIDVSDILKTSAVDMQFLGGNKIVLFDLREETLTVFDYSLKQTSKTLNLKEYFSKNLPQKLQKLLHDSLTVAYNLEVLSNPKVDLDKGFIGLYNLDVRNNRVYLGVRYLVRENVIGLAQSMSYKLMITEFNENLNFLNDFPLPDKLDGDFFSYLDVMFMRVLDSNKVMLHITSGKKYKDTLVATFKIEPDIMAKQLSVYHCVLPAYLPRFDKKNGFPNFYQVNLVWYNDKPYYFYYRDFIFRQLGGKDSISLSLFEKPIKKNQDFYIQSIFSDISGNLVLTNYYKNETRLYFFDLPFKTLKADVSLLNGSFNRVILDGEKIFGLRILPDKTLLYRYSIVRSPK